MSRDILGELEKERRNLEGTARGKRFNFQDPQVLEESCRMDKLVFCYYRSLN